MDPNLIFSILENLDSGNTLKSNFLENKPTLANFTVCINF